MVFVLRAIHRLCPTIQRSRGQTPQANHRLFSASEPLRHRSHRTVGGTAQQLAQIGCVSPKKHRFEIHKQQPKQNLTKCKTTNLRYSQQI